MTVRRFIAWTLGAIVLLSLMGVAGGVALGGRARALTSGSMEPAYAPSDLVITYPTDSYKAGDVVLMSIPGHGDVVHRIRVVNPDGTLVTRGDHHDHDDPWSSAITASAVRGKVVFSIPKAGVVALWVGQHRVISALFVVSVLGLLAWLLLRPRPVKHAVTAGT